MVACTEAIGRDLIHFADQWLKLQTIGVESSYNPCFEPDHAAIEELTCKAVAFVMLPAYGLFVLVGGDAFGTSYRIASKASAAGLSPGLELQGRGPWTCLFLGEQFLGALLGHCSQCPSVRHHTISRY